MASENGVQFKGVQKGVNLTKYLGSRANSGMNFEWDFNPLIEVLETRSARQNKRQALLYQCYKTHFSLSIINSSQFDFLYDHFKI